MYFNEKHNSTNIDDNFSKGFKINKKLLTLIVAIVSSIALVFVIIFATKPIKKEVTYYLVLDGNTDIILFKGTDYHDPGYKAYDSEGNDYSSQVIVDGNVNSSVAGDYVIKYTFNDIVKERVISVVHSSNDMTMLTLNGEDVIYLGVGEQYVEPGYLVFDSNNTDLSDKVVVKNEVNNQVPGIYKIYYTLINDLGVTLTEDRTVIVYGSVVNLFADTSKYVNDKVTINVIITDNYLDRVVLPDGTFTDKRNFTYDVTENGDYKFLVYSKNNALKEETITINNIDKVLPTASCKAVVDTKTSVTVSASDNIGISEYEYILDGKSTGYTTQNYYNSTELVKSVTVNVKDNAGNVTLTNCDVDIILPPSSSSKPSSSSSKNPSSSSSKKPSSSSIYGGDGNINVVPISNIIPCNGDRTKYNNHLLSLVNKHGKRKRATATAIGKYISSEIGVKIPYFWAGGHWHYEWDGSKNTEMFRGFSPQWGCITSCMREFNGTNKLPAGFDCTGFVAWVLFNSGFTKSEIGSWSGEKALTYLGGKKLTVIDFKGSTGSIQAGDIVWRTGHMGFVIGVNGSTVTIAHAKGTAYGLVVEKYNSDTGKLIGGSGNFMKVSLMDNYYE